MTRALIGEPEAAIEHAAGAIRLSPHDPQMAGMQTATAAANFVASRYGEARFWAEAAIRAALLLPVAGAALAGAAPEAEQATARLRQLDPALRLSHLEELLPFRRQEDHERWAEGRRKARWVEVAPGHYGPQA